MGCFCPVLVNQCNLHWQNGAESTQFTDECKKQKKTANPLS
jgi:hypothetical protein